jgi:hypothetical protein
MKSYIVYDDRNGKILRSVFCTENDSLIQIKETWEKIIEGQAKDDENYIENNKIISISTKPSINHVFDYETKTWVLGNVDYIAEQIKEKRNKLLKEFDWTQLPNNPLTLEKQQAWAVYRQQLRDIPQQSGYPTNVIWPTQPE